MERKLRLMAGSGKWGVGNG